MFYQSAFQWCLGVRLPRFEAKTTLCFYSGFKRDVLTPGVGEMCLKNRFVEPARPCCFAAAEPSFLAGSWCCGGINRLFNGVWA